MEWSEALPNGNFSSAPQRGTHSGMLLFQPDGRDGTLFRSSGGPLEHAVVCGPS